MADPQHDCHGHRVRLCASTEGAGLESRASECPMAQGRDSPRQQ
jgi:hypothetical protein